MTRKPWHHSKQSRHDRGYGAQWVKTRTIIIGRDRGLCQPCERSGRVTPFTEVDHIKPKSQGGNDDHGNLECICADCHQTKTQAEAMTAQGKQSKPRPMFTPDGNVIWGDR